MRLGARVRSLRHKYGWTINDLADSCGLHPSYVASLERGERNVSLVNLVRLAEAFEMKVAELLRDV